jgi:hypothetical protein
VDRSVAPSMSPPGTCAASLAVELPRALQPTLSPRIAVCRAPDRFTSSASGVRTLGSQLAGSEP